ncbi:helix-turn-helix transcriptional regulator [Cytobacillus sp. FSL R5-0569]|uniref:helix-turn-helix domain-containing protein n=1 Tax=Cytobacillus sp. FSL R5-0569 TaxID=2921649 RepID=UPI0030F4EDDD
MKKSTDIIVKVNFLKKYLNDNNLSESKFAETIGVAHSTVNRIFNGKRNPGSKFIAGVLKNYTDLNFDSVFSYENELPKGNKKHTA